MDIYNIEALVIVLVSAMLIIYSIKNYICSREWYDLLLIIIGGLWFALYVYVLFAPPVNSAWFGQTFIRPLNWVTLTILIVVRRVLEIVQKAIGRYNGRC